VIQNLLLVQGAAYHLWFLYYLLGIYLIVPLLRLMVQAAEDRQILWYFIGLWLIFQPGLTMAKQFWGFKINLSAPMATGFTGFFILGYLLGSWVLSRSTIILSAVAFFLGALGTIIGTYLMTRDAGQFDGFFYDLVSLPVIVASAGAFLWLRWMAEAKVFASPKVHDFLRLLASTTFGIYLIHVLIIEIFRGWIPGFRLDSFIGNPVWSIPLVSSTVFVLSFLIVRVLQKIPALNQIVPG
jgi:surface polysaccharide O-acyltransferase-like enzyme